MKVSNKRVIVLSLEDLKEIVGTWLAREEYAKRGDNISIAVDISGDKYEPPTFEGLTIVIEQDTAN